MPPLVGTSVMATSASRDAENADEFAALLARRGLRLQVIAGDVEAMMSFIGASSAYGGECVCVVDVGGGSTEVSAGIGGIPPAFSHSFDIGCRRVTERFWDGYPPSAAAIGRARAWICEQLGDIGTHLMSRATSNLSSGESGEGFGDAGVTLDVFRCHQRLPHRCLAVAGTATSAVSIRERMAVYDAERVDGARVTLADLRAITGRLAAKTLPELENVTGLDPRRAPVIVAGMVILEEVMAAVGADAFTASESDVLDGMIMYNAMAERTGN